MNIAVWTVQGLLALVFLFSGGMKVFAFDRFKKMTEKRSPEHGLGFSASLARFIGVSELAGSLGLVLPQATGTSEWLTPMAALGLAVIMVLAIIHHRRRSEPAAAPVVFLVLALVVLVGRSFER
jgi:uncharacterized membrane protein YphA (DoxX/SURF4 family)